MTRSRLSEELRPLTRIPVRTSVLVIEAQGDLVVLSDTGRRMKMKQAVARKSGALYFYLNSFSSLLVHSLVIESREL